MQLYSPKMRLDVDISIPFQVKCPHLCFPFCLLGLILLVILSRHNIKRRFSSGSELARIPTPYTDNPIMAIFKFIFKTQEYLRQGYYQTKLNEGLFKLPGPSRWIVVVSCPNKIRDMYRAHSDQISSFEAIDEILQFTYTLSPEILRDPYHLPFLHTWLTKRLDDLFPDIYDEIRYSFEKRLGKTEDTGKSAVIMKVGKLAEECVNRVSNRIFVGKSLCRNNLYLWLVAKYTFSLTIIGFILSGTPKCMRGFLAFFISPSWLLNFISLITAPTIKSRREQPMPLTCDQDDAKEPLSDILSALILREGKETSCRDLTRRIVHLNFAAVSSTSAILTLVLNHIAAQPAWQQEIYSEILDAVDRMGFTYEALTHMSKLDSLIKEVMRYHHFSSTTIGRVVVNKPFVFSDGTSVPPGTLLCAASREVALEHFGPEFKPFRFAKDKDRLPTDSCTTSTKTFMAWGHGRHACPGRYFAVCQIKAIAAYAILNYKLSISDGRTPKIEWQFVMSAPEKNLDFLFEPRT